MGTQKMIPKLAECCILEVSQHVTLDRVNFFKFITTYIIFYAAYQYHVRQIMCSSNSMHLSKLTILFENKAATLVNLILSALGGYDE